MHGFFRGFFFFNFRDRFLKYCREEVSGDDAPPGLLAPEAKTGDGMDYDAPVVANPQPSIRMKRPRSSSVEESSQTPKPTMDLLPILAELKSEPREFPVDQRARADADDR